MESEQLQSCCGPSQLAHHGDLKSLKRSKLQKLHLHHQEQLRACSDILSNVLSERPHQSPSNVHVPVNSAVIHS